MYSGDKPPYNLSNAQKSSKSKYILFSIEGGGCNGLKYNLEPNNDEPKKIDEIVKIDDLKINVCGKSLLYLFSAGPVKSFAKLPNPMGQERRAATTFSSCSKPFGNLRV